MYNVTPNDIADYFNTINILDVLKDIVENDNLDDDRVLVYMYNLFLILKQKSITGAESLMRLNIDGKVITPNKFISVAENSGTIHQLTLILLNKLCKNLKKLMNEGYESNRVSVNFSSISLLKPSFCSDVKKIIKNNKIPFEMIGVEITESEAIFSDSEILSRVNDLHESGIKLYLDDFGTGYSNFERLIQFPFDIIKFDKSLLESAQRDEKMKKMIFNFSKTYSDLDYKILFEGVETEKDVKLCLNEMKSNYLQGYFYSRPVPFEEIKEFLKK